MFNHYMLPEKKFLFRVRFPNGFTAVELLAALIIFSILSAIAVVGIAKHEQKACQVILEYDLRKFFEAETVFYAEHDTFKGTIGDIVSNDPTISSTFSLETFLPSQNTSITIINIKEDHNKLINNLNKIAIGTTSVEEKRASEKALSMVLQQTQRISEHLSQFKIRSLP